MGAIRNTALNELNMRGIGINPAAGTNTITVAASDSGIMFINKNSTANTNYVLPAVTLGEGKMWWFLNSIGGKGFRVTAPTNTLVATNAVIKNYVQTATSNIGFHCMIVGDGSKYYLFQLDATAFTVA